MDAAPATTSDSKSVETTDSPAAVPANAENTAEKSSARPAAGDCGEGAVKSSPSPATPSPGHTAAPHSQSSAFANMSSGNYIQIMAKLLSKSLFIKEKKLGDIIHYLIQFEI